MIFVDTNYFLRLMTAPRTDQDNQMIDQAARLFRSAATGDQKLTTSDAVIGEVFFVLGGSAYNFSVQHIVRTIRPILNVRGMQSETKRFWLQALEFLDESPNMKFVDALAAAYCILGEMELATFDKKLARFPGLSAYSPDRE